MTGAGSSDVLIAHESDFLGAPLEDGSGNIETFEAGRNPSLSELDLQRELERLRQGNEVESVESIAQTIEGAVSIEGTVSTDVHGEIHKLVFNNGGTAFQAGRPNSARIYVGVDYLDGSVDRELKGVIPLEYTISYEEGGQTTYSLSLGYATETKDTTIPTDAITEVSDGSSAPFHAFSLSVDGAAVTKLQSAELTISDIARFQRGGDPEPVDAVIAAPETSLTLSAIITGPDMTELAYGGTNEPADQLDSVSGEADVTVDGTTAATYDLPKITPSSVSWSNVISTDDTTEGVEFNVDGGIEVVN